MVNSLLSFIRKSSLYLMLAILLVVINLNPSWAHRPHDVVTQLEISPQYNQDKTLFIIVRDNLLRSKDGGQNFTRIFNGLDNHDAFGSLAISPQNPNHLLVSAAEDGIYKTEDGGNSWFHVNNGLIDYKVDLIKISPYSDAIAFAAGLTQGLYRTQDGGKNWSQVIEDRKITAIAFTPKHNDKIFVGDELGNLYISQDQGKTWRIFSSLKGQDKITAIAFSPKFEVDKTILIGTENNGMFKSTDGGVTFIAVNNGITDKRIRDIFIVSNQNQDFELFASTWSQAIFRSTNVGNSWVPLDQGLKKDIQADEMKLPHFSGIKTSNAFNQDQTLFIAGFNGLFKSQNAGKDWRKLETLARGTITGLAISPNYLNDSSLAIGTYVGNIYISRDGGKTWRSYYKGLEVPRFTGTFETPYQDPRRFFDIAYSPNYKEDRTLFASVLWSKVLKSTDSGDFWHHIELPNVKGKLTRGLSLLVSPNFGNDKTVFVSTQFGVIYRSKDQGKSFLPVSKLNFETTNFPVSLVISPNFSEDKTLYAAGSRGVYQSFDEGSTWQAIATESSLSQALRTQLAISPNYQTDKTLLAGTNRGLFITQDGGNSWSEIEISASGNSVFVEGVAISPDFKNDRTILVSIRGRGLFKSVDGGQNFTEIGDSSIQLAKMNSVPSGSVPIRFSPAYAVDKTIYGFGSATTEVFKSVDRGATWEVIPVPQEFPDSLDWITYTSIWLVINSRQILTIIFSLIAAILAYLLVGNLNLQKRLPLSKLQIRAIATFLVFAISVIVFTNLFHANFANLNHDNAILNDRS